MVLVTGPTGSGKTTTLYSALNHLNQTDTKIITVEDPVEYRLDRVNQVQVNAKIGLDFARVLRTTLRQDPDIILVGEMRDQETVDIGLRAAITGHLVFSTLHTMNAVATVHRLLDMGAAGYMIAAARARHRRAAPGAPRLRRTARRTAEPDAHQLAWLHAQVGAARRARCASARARAARTAISPAIAAAWRSTSCWRSIARSPTPSAAAIACAFARRARAARPATCRWRRARWSWPRTGVTSLAEAIGVTSGLDERAMRRTIAAGLAGRCARRDAARSDALSADRTRRCAMPLFTLQGPFAARRAGHRPHRWRNAGQRRRAPVQRAASRRSRSALRGERRRTTSREARAQLGLGKPTTADLVLFSRQMYTITKSGIPLLRGLRGLAASTHNAVLREALEDVLSSLEARPRSRDQLRAASEDLPAAVRQHRARRRSDRHAGSLVPAPRRIPAAGPGHAGSHQERHALSDHRDVRRSRSRSACSRRS